MIKSSNNKKYIGLVVIAAVVLLLINFIAGFHVNTTLKQSLSQSEAKASQVSRVNATIENGVQIIRMTADNNGYTPSNVYVQKGTPVKLIIEGNQLNSCNDGIVLPDFNIEKTIKSGENIMEFTAKDGNIDFSCWMGMIKGVIKVTDNLG